MKFLNLGQVGFLVNWWLSYAVRVVIAGVVLIGKLAFANSDAHSILNYTCGQTLYPGNGSRGGASYTRVIRLHYNGSANGRLLATFENYATKNFGIYRSDDDGLNWTSSPIGVCSEQKNPGWELRAQPCLFELPIPMGNLSAGTLLLAANSETNVTTAASEIEIYSSTNLGVTWQYRASVDFAPDSVAGGIWEPELLLATNGCLVCLYADERQNGSGYNQMISEKVSTNGGFTWGPRQSVMAIQDSVARPGMPVTAKLPNGQFIMSVEAINTSSFGQVHIKFSWDGINWGSGPSDYGTAVTTSNGASIGKTPYICWSPAGGSNGTLVISGHNLSDGQNSDRQLFLNTSLGQGPWTMMPAPVQWQGCNGKDSSGNYLTERAGYSTAMIPTADGTGIIQLAASGIKSNSCAIKYGRQPVVLPGNIYTEIVNQNSGLAVDIPGNSNAQGALLQQWTPAGGPAQRWLFNYVGNNLWTIQNPFNNKVWDVSGGGTNEGTAVDQLTYTGATRQQWKLRPGADGYWKFISANSGLLLAVNGASLSPGASLIQASENGSLDHNWLLKQAGATPTGLAAENTIGGEVTLIWNASVGATNYYVKRSTSSGGEVTVGSTTNTTYVDNGLVNGQAYYYKVSALADGGEGNNSDEVSVVVLQYILEASGGGAPGTDWNQGGQWVGGLTPTTSSGYVLLTNSFGSGYDGVASGGGLLRTPADASASTFLGNSLIIPLGAELLLKETPGGSASANIIFRDYGNVSSGSGMYPMVRLSPDSSGPGEIALAGTIKVETDSYLAVDYTSTNLTLKIASAVAGIGNLTLISLAGGSVFSATKTHLITGDWSGFSGTLNIGNTTIGGVVELNNSAVNTNMALALPNTNSVLILDKVIGVASLVVGGHPVSDGTYTTAQLTALGYGGAFYGAGSLIVGAAIVEVSTGAGSGTDWNQGDQWTGAALPTSNHQYIVCTNTTGTPGLGNYYGVNFGKGRLRTPADANASTFQGGSLILPIGAELLLKETPGGAASANIRFSDYNNVGTGSGVYPMVRLSPNPAGPGVITLNGTINNETDSYLAADYASTNLTLKIASAVSGTGNMTFVSSAVNAFSSTKTNLVTGNWNGFTGTLCIGNTTIGGVVELNNSAVNTNMALAMPNTNSLLILDKVIGVRAFEIAGHSVADGSYTSPQLAALGYGGRFFGAGSLIIANTQTTVSQVSTNISITLDSKDLVLLWPADHTGWQLQMQTNGLGSNWVNVPNSTTTNIVTLPVDLYGPSVFFRLLFSPTDSQSK